MTHDEAIRRLINPVFQALTTRHTALAAQQNGMLRYWPQVLPFAAVERPNVELQADQVLESGTVFFCDVLPKIVGEGVSLQTFPVPQMLYTGPLEPPARMPAEVELTLEDSPAMVDLTDAAFPGFFRVDTPRLGRYIGLREEVREGEHAADKLIAMAGERFRVPGLWEISAVCTRPGHTGKGYAAHLMRRLMDRRDEEQPFLHVAGNNARAIALYERLGFVHLRTIHVLKVSKA